jgi:hypothetical protein
LPISSDALVRSSEPQAHRIEGREGDVANAELQWHDEIHEPDHERHRDEKDHDRAVGREDLVVVVGRQVAARVEGHRLLAAHHDRVGEAANEHDHGEQAVHDADPLVIDGGDPLAPEIGPPAFDGDPEEHRQDDRDHHDGRDERDRLVEGNRRPGELAKHQFPLHVAAERS